jgi:hypothetical protein
MTLGGGRLGSLGFALSHPGIANTVSSAKRRGRMPSRLAAFTGASESLRNCN